MIEVYLLDMAKTSYPSVQDRVAIGKTLVQDSITQIQIPQALEIIKAQEKLLTI